MKRRKRELGFSGTLTNETAYCLGRCLCGVRISELNPNVVSTFFDVVAQNCLTPILYKLTPFATFVSFVTLGKSIVVKLLPLGLLSSWALAVRYCQGTTGMKSPRSLNLNVTATNLSLNAPTNPLFGALKETALSSFAPIDPKSKNYTDTNTNIYDMNSGRGGSVQKVPTLEFSGSFSSSSLFISALAIYIPA